MKSRLYELISQTVKLFLIKVFHYNLSNCGELLGLAISSLL